MHAPAAPSRPQSLPPAALSLVARVYVGTVAVVALVSLWGDSSWWHVVLVALASPLSLLAMWVSFYARLAVAFAFGLDPAVMSLPVAVVWVAVWTLTAWVNAQLLSKVLRSGWRTVAARPVEPYDED